MEGFEIQYAGCNCVKTKCENDSCLCIHLKSIGINYFEKKLLSHILSVNSHKPVFECNSQCQCTVANCENRAIQLGIQFRLAVVKTRLKGWGLKTLDPIPFGAFVCEYAGEILCYSEAKERITDKVILDNNYIIAVKEHFASEEIITYVDPSYIGNIGRFANHSCSPNLKMVPIRIDNAIPRLALFANKRIEANEELCFDYSGGCQPLPPTAPNLKECFCGSDSCFKTLPYDEALFLNNKSEEIKS